MPGARLEWLVLAGIVLAVGVFSIGTLRPGHPWGDDYAMYILHAKNIVGLSSYESTPYIYNPALAMAVGPRSYPPIFPLLLAPVYAMFGPDLEKLKWVVVLSLLVALIAIGRGIARSLPFPLSTTLVALVGFSPIVWDFKDSVLSDIPFLALVYLALHQTERLIEASRRSESRIPQGLILGLLIYLAYGTRAVGGILLPCALLAEYLATRRVSRSTLACVAIFAVLAGLQNLFLHGEGDYLRALVANPAHVASNVVGYVRSVYAYSGGRAPAIALLLLAGVGLWGRLRSGVTVYELFGATYLLVLLAFPFSTDLRGFLLLAPIFFCYALLGIVRLVSIVQRPQRAWLAAGAVLLVASVGYARAYRELDFGPIREGIGAPETRELLDFIQHKTSPGSVFVFWKPRSLALYGERPSAAVRWDTQEAELWTYLASIQARYVIAGPLENHDPREIAKRDPDVAGLLGRNPARFEWVFENREFRVFELHPPAQETPASGP